MRRPNKEELYTNNQICLSEALEQLANLTCLANLNDITWKNCPIIFDPVTKTHSKIALVNYPGPLGGPSKNWTCFLTPEHADLVKSIFIKHNKDTSCFNN